MYAPTMKKILLLLLIPCLSFAQLTPAQVNTLIDNNLSDNNTRNISPAVLRATLHQIVNTAAANSHTPLSLGSNANGLQLNSAGQVLELNTSTLSTALGMATLTNVAGGIQPITKTAFTKIFNDGNGYATITGFTMTNIVNVQLTGGTNDADLYPNVPIVTIVSVSTSPSASIKIAFARPNNVNSITAPATYGLKKSTSLNDYAYVRIDGN